MQSLPFNAASTSKQSFTLCQGEEEEEKEDEQLGEESFTEVWKRMEETQMLMGEVLADLSSFLNRLVLASAAANGLCRYHPLFICIARFADCYAMFKAYPFLPREAKQIRPFLQLCKEEEAEENDEPEERFAAASLAYGLICEELNQQQQ